MAGKNIVQRFFELLGISAKLDLAWLLRDTKYALLAIASDIIVSLSMVSGVFLISVRFGGIGGMCTNEVLFMMAYSTMVSGLMNLFGCGNNIHISRIIGRGQLEHFFVQPLPLSLQLLTCGFNPFTAGSNLLVGICLMALAVKRLGLTITPFWVFSLCAYLFVTFVIVVAWAYFVSSAAFYAPLAAEEISYTAIDEMWHLTTFPLSGMPSFIQIPLITVFPQGLMAWFPALCLLGKPPLGLSAYYPMLFALLLAFTASIFFKRGLNHYVKRGSNRYVSHGFRR
ncbi:ABC transporter permease [Ruminococcaceae bacterium OttesenSCG-928-N02]|nr:ABC transporter permease [Ruminococcaceae bacterium OttesenSCG-928-N02]